MKRCRICGKDQPLTAYRIRKDSGKHRTECTPCWNLQASAYYKSNKASINLGRKEIYKEKMATNPTYHAEWYATNKEKSLINSRSAYLKHREKRLAAVKVWASNNRSKRNAIGKAYKATKIKACPEWVRNDPELMWMMNEAYELAQLRTKMLGFVWHVDHIVPLRGKTVCGLHVPWNLQVISAVENIRKSNKLMG